ncbi:phospholipase D-like domain-containing protein [Spirosoma areae]
MRKKSLPKDLTIFAVAGMRVVTLGLDFSGQKRVGCLGFAIKREDHTNQETFWMRGIKTFEATLPHPDPAVPVSSREHPFQSFQWSDYSVEPGQLYTYTVVPLYGSPTHLTEGEANAVTIKTEPITGNVHSIYFNRGTAASQEYTRRFQDRKPPVVGQLAYDWLSRGLFEALITFIARATGPDFALHGAIYEFQWPGVLEALKAAAARGVQVQVLYDAIAGGSGPRERNIEAVEKAGINNLTTQRVKGKLMHNKFLVLTNQNQAVAVWTGSTNLTENGIFGHSNVGHIVDDAGVATTYLTYLKKLREDPTKEESQNWLGTNNPAPPNPWNKDITVVFSPHLGKSVLSWYAQVANSAQKGLFMTFAFGMNKVFQQVYEQNDGVLRFALMEKEGAGAGLAQGKIDIARIRKLPNVVVALGNRLTLNAFDRWVKEIDRPFDHDGIQTHVLWIHTKYMLVDPLGENPVTITGSANFSGASTDINDENMLVIRNDKRVADCYLGEFMRLHTHYAYREAVKIAQQQGIDEADWKPNYLIADDGWQHDYFDPTHPRSLRRVYFSGK